MKRKLSLNGVLALFVMMLLPVGMEAKVDGNRPVELKVMSYNIRNGLANDGTNAWEFRAPATMMMLEDQQPDVVGLQEAYKYQLTGILTFADDFKAVGKGREDGKNKGEQAAILYNKKKVKLMKWGTFWLSETPGTPSKGWDAACERTATWALMKEKKSGKVFYFVNTHLDHVGVEARKKGLALIASEIKRINHKNYPVILTGDFNVTLGDPCLDVLDGFMKSARETAVNTDRGGSYNNWGKQKPASPIDYIYHSGFSSCLVFDIVDKPYYNRQFISDHFPISAIFIF